MQEDFNKYDERAIERKVLAIYMIFVVLLFVTQVLVYGNASFIIWTFPEVVTCWVVYFSGIKDKKTRAYIYTSMALVSFFGYGDRKSVV